MPARRRDPVFAAIAAHREALAEFSGELHYFGKKRSFDLKPEFRAAKEQYYAATTTLASTKIATRPGLQAFIDYIEELDAHRLPVTWYNAIWHSHLSDAMATVSEALRRLYAPRPRAPRLPSFTAEAACAAVRIH